MQRGRLQNSNRRLAMKLISKLIVNDIIIENNEMLFPLLKDEMVSIMRKVGFKNIKIYGNFKGEDFDEKVSLPVIITGEVI